MLLACTLLFFILFFIIFIVLGYVICVAPMTRRYLFGIFIVTALIQTIINQKKLANPVKSKFLYTGLGVYLFGQTMWILDKNGVWCNPYASIMNGHGVWHICSGDDHTVVYLLGL